MPRKLKDDSAGSAYSAFNFFDLLGGVAKTSPPHQFHEERSRANQPGFVAKGITPPEAFTGTFPETQCHSNPRSAK